MIKKRRRRSVFFSAVLDEKNYGKIGSLKTAKEGGKSILSSEKRI